MNAIQELNDAIRSLQDIRRLHRYQVWELLPDRYASLRQDLIAIKGRTPSLTQSHKDSIQGAIQQLSIMEGQVESAIAGQGAPQVQQINKAVSRQIDRLAILLVELQNDVK
jgi:hypothetical protein